MRLSIRSKLVVAICTPLVAVYLVVLVVDYRTGRDTALRNMQNHITELVAHYAAKFDGRFSTDAQVARSAATFLETRPDTNEKQLYDLLRNTVKDNARVYGSCIAFEPNRFYPNRPRFAPYVWRAKKSLSSMEVTYDYFRWDWYLIPSLLQQPVWTDPYYDEGAGNILMCSHGVPFKREGAFAGVVTVDISLEDLRDEVGSVRISGGYCLILGHNGVVVSHPDKSWIMRETVFSLAEWYQVPEMAELGRAMISGKSGLQRLPDFRTREPKWIAFAPIPSCGWSFAAVIPEDKVTAPVYASLRRNAALLLGEMVLVVGLIMLTAFQITRPVSKLAKVVHEVATGNLNVQATDIHTHDEIGDFAQAFNKMVGDLKAHVAALTRETAAREAVESEIRVARSIQASLLPRTFPPFPDRKEFSLFAVNSPAKQVAGDFFDFYFITDSVLVITIADVSGKGVPAALFMAVTRTLLKNLAQSGLSPSQTLERTNDILSEENDESMFVTLFFGLYDTRTGHLRFANAGHNPPVVVGRQGAISSPRKPTGAILGVFDSQKYGEDEIKLGPGDTLVLYTDGVTEAHAPNHELYGEKRFQKLLTEHAPEGPELLSKAVVEAVNVFQHGNQFDDVTLLILRRNM